MVDASLLVGVELYIHVRPTSAFHRIHRLGATHSSLRARSQSHPIFKEMENSKIVAGVGVLSAPLDRKAWHPRTDAYLYRVTEYRLHGMIKS